MKNKLFEAKEKEMIEKYHEQINYISEEYGCDEYVSLLILQRTLVNKKEGINMYQDIDVDYNELAVDIAELDALRRK